MSRPTLPATGAKATIRHEKGDDTRIIRDLGALRLRGDAALYAAKPRGIGGDNLC